MVFGPWAVFAACNVYAEPFLFPFDTESGDEFGGKGRGKQCGQNAYVFILATGMLMCILPAVTST